MWDLRNVEGSGDAEPNTWKLEAVVLVAHGGIDLFEVGFKHSKWIDECQVCELISRKVGPMPRRTFTERWTGKQTREKQ